MNFIARANGRCYKYYLQSLNYLRSYGNKNIDLNPFQPTDVFHKSLDMQCKTNGWFLYKMQHPTKMGWIGWTICSHNLHAIFYQKIIQKYFQTIFNICLEKCRGLRLWRPLKGFPNHFSRHYKVVRKKFGPMFFRND